MSKRRTCPFLWACFGLNKEYLEKVVYEEIFMLIKHMNWSFSEAYSLPVGLRRWFIRRLVKYSEDQNSKDK